MTVIPTRARGWLARAFALSACLAFALEAHAASPAILQPPAVPSLAYSIFSDAQAQSSITLVSKNYSGPVCVVFTELSRFPSPAPTRGYLAYGLFSADGSMPLSLTGTASGPQELLSGSFPPNSRKNDEINLAFSVKAMSASLPLPGTHRISLRANLYASAYPPAGGVVASVTFSVSVGVGSYYDVSVVPQGGGFSSASTTASLAFGSLVAGESRNVDILARCNVSCNLSLSSANGGSFKCLSDPSAIPYSLTSNGASVALDQGTQAFISFGGTPGYEIPARYGIAITVLPYSSMVAEGAYSDTIFITLSAH
jgi:hypothetical protein